MSEEIWTEQLNALREGFDAGVLGEPARRVARLKDLRRKLSAGRREILSALFSDLNKSEAEAMMSEWLPVMKSLDYFIRHTRRLAGRRHASLSMFNWPGRGWLQPEPRGVVLIAATWNYPLSLALEPVIGAIAAGNCVMLKLSGTAQATSIALAKLLRAVFPANELTTVNTELAELLNGDFDLVFFTGGHVAGKLVAEAAARKLTPVVLELGGKCPCIVDESADLNWSARRIVWGKFLNAGQSCVAPDYLLVHKSVKDDLMVAIRKAIRSFYGDNPQESRDYGRIVNKFHYERLCALLSEGRLIAGGECGPDDLFIAPTVLDGVNENGPLMEAEIFGPILPVFEFETMGDAIQFVTRRPKPLAIYYFGRSRHNRKRVLLRTSSGGVGVNDTVNWMLNGSMPFGGVGASGMGAYHGPWSFDTFSHLKPVQTRCRFPELPVRFPPFTAWKLALMKFFTR